VSTHHIAGGTANFFADVQRCYERFDPHTPDGLRLPASTDIPTGADEFDMSRHFAAAEVRRYEWERTYRTREYIDLLLTYSGHRALPTNQ
jgi:hypothetical protein